jgi:Ca-activated chloride channel homolog
MACEMQKCESGGWMPTGQKRASWGIGLIVLLAFAGGANRMDGQDRRVTSEPANTVIDKAWPEVNVNVLVLDKSGAPQKVDEGQFQLFEDRAERPLRFPASADSPVSLAFLIDSSGSTYKRKPDIVSAVTAILHALPAGSEVMASSFADKAYLEFPFAPVSQADLSFMDRLPAAGPTALYDAVVATEQYFVANAKYPRRALIILSDGEDNASHFSIGVAYAVMDWPGAPLVYPCLIGKAQFLKPETEYGRNHMKFLAKWGGGPTFNLDPDPTAAAAEIVAAVRSQYVLQFTAADPTHNGKGHKLEVRLPVKDVRIYGHPAYFAPIK